MTGIVPEVVIALCLWARTWKLVTNKQKRTLTDKQRNGLVSTEYLTREVSDPM